MNSSFESMSKDNLSAVFLLVIYMLTSGAYAQSFAPVITYTTSSSGSGPRGLAVGDVNGDNQPDIIYIEGNPVVRVLLGQQGGSFVAATTYSIPLNPNDVAIGDMNGDGRQDVVVAGGTGPINVGIMQGQASGVLAPATAYSTGSSYIAGLILRDFNSDGQLDIVTSNYNTGTNPNTNNVSVLLGQGNGQLSPAGSFLTGMPVSFDIGMALGDVNGDGLSDIVTTTNGAGTNNVSVLLRQSGGGVAFDPPRTFSAGGSPVHVVLGDVNGDGLLDIVTANRNANTIGLLLGQGAGTFTSASTYAVSGFPTRLALGDLNGDGRLDVVANNRVANRVEVLLGKNGGGFDPALSFNVGGEPYYLALSDLNKDGRLDIVTANLTGPFSATAGVLLNTGTVLTSPIPVSASAVTLYPNPALENFTVLLPNRIKAMPIQAVLFNALGQVVRRIEAIPAKSSFTISTVGLPSGVYTLRLEPIAVVKRVVVK
ncbi:FG-GAP-like repeat-containing protein [Hymenobacter sp. HD11105]